MTTTNREDIIERFYQAKCKADKKSEEEYIKTELNSTAELKERFYKIKLFYTIWLNKNYDGYSTDLNFNFLCDETISIDIYGSTKSLFITKRLKNTSKYPSKVTILIRFNEDGEVVNVNKENSTQKDKKILQDKYNEFLNLNKKMSNL